MSEKLLGGEHHVELITAEAESRRNLERIQQQPESESKPDLQEIQANIEQHALAAEHVAPSLQEQAPASAPIGTQKALKSEAYKRTLQRLQSRLNGPERAFSTVIHTKTIDSISTIGSKTVARPSGLIGGASFALIGTSVALYLARHYGWEYNFLLFFWLFLIGFAVGLLIEVPLRWYHRRHA